MFNKLLIGIAFSPHLKKNIFEVVRLVNQLDCRLIGVHVGEETDEKHRKLNSIIENIPQPPKYFEIIFQKGSPVKVILDICRKENIDLLVLGALKKENIFRYYVSSISRHLTRKAPCSVMLFIRHTLDFIPRKNIVVSGGCDDGLKNIKTAFEIGKCIGGERITIVEEIESKQLEQASDDFTLQKSTVLKRRKTRQEQNRTEKILNKIPNDLKRNTIIKNQPIFGLRGYSIGHYARVVKANLLVLHYPYKDNIWKRFFNRDIEYILSDIPTDLLILK